MLFKNKEVQKYIDSSTKCEVTNIFSGPDRQDETGQTGQYGGRHKYPQF